ncbi:MAG: hypothetical protein AAB834_06390 [Patescibacteria group bacterium]
MEGGRRYFHWPLDPSDLAMAEMAGWNVFPFSNRDGIGRLELPTEIRSASSALAGAEAWLGEKDQILSAMSGYARKIYERFGYVDTNLQLDSVAVTRGNDIMCMVPPHNLRPEGEATAWLDRLQQDVRDVLGGDPRRDELLHGFQTAMEFLTEGQQP